MRRLVVSALVLVVGVSSASAVRDDASAAHPCQLISDREVSRVLARAHLEVGGSTCRVHRGTPMVGVITVNTDTRAKFSALRQNIASHRKITVFRGLGEAAFLDVYPPSPGPGGPTYTVFVSQRGHRLLVTSFASSFTPAQGRRVAAIVAPRI